MASDVHPGDAADDPLYLPMIRRVRALLGQTGLLYTGDCKMAALETRAEIDAQGDFYFTRLPMTGETKESSRPGSRRRSADAKREELVAIRIGGRVGRAWATSSSDRRPRRGRHDRTHLDGAGPDDPLRVDRPRTRPRALERRLEKAEAAVRGLTPPPGPGKTQFTTGWELEQAVAAVLAEHEVEGLLEVDGPARRPAGRGTSVGAEVVRIAPRRPNGRSATRSRRYGATTSAIQERVARMGWRVQVTNVPAQTAVAAWRRWWRTEAAGVWKNASEHEVSVGIQ